MEVSLGIDSIFWNLRPRRFSMVTHVPELFCTGGLPWEPSRKTNNCNWSWVGNVRRFFGQPIDLNTVLRPAARRHGGGLHHSERSYRTCTNSQCSSSQAFG